MSGIDPGYAKSGPDPEKGEGQRNSGPNKSAARNEALTLNKGHEQKESVAAITAPLEEAPPASEGPAKTPPDEKKSFASVTSFDDLFDHLGENFSWADITAQDEEIHQREIELMNKKSLADKIRQKTGITAENRISLPSNLALIPDLEKNFIFAARLAGLEVVRDETAAIKLSHPKVYSTDEVTSGDAISALVNTHGSEKILDGIACVSILGESLLRLPKLEGMNIRGPGKSAVGLTLGLFVRVYHEQVANTAISKQRGWWKITNATREIVLLRLREQMGSEKAAQSIMGAFEIVYRRFVRISLTKTGRVTEEYSSRVKKISKEMTEALIQSGASVTTSFYKTEKRRRMIEIEVPRAKGGGTQKIRQQVDYTAIVKPQITDAPMSAAEKTVTSAINQAYGKLETLAKNYSPDSGKNIAQWCDGLKLGVSREYSRLQPISNLLKRRRDITRERVLTSRAKLAAPTGTQGTAIVAQQDKITPAEWIKASAELYPVEGGIAADFNKIICESFNLAKSVELKDLSEEGFVTLLRELVSL
jgi:ribosomal protein L17